MYAVTMFKYVAASYFALEAVIRNEFAGDEISCAAGLDADTRTLLDDLFPNASVSQRVGFRQMARPQPG